MEFLCTLDCDEVPEVGGEHSKAEASRESKNYITESLVIYFYKSFSKARNFFLVFMKTEA